MDKKTPTPRAGETGVAAQTRRARARLPAPEVVDQVDLSLLEQLIGYNARRTALTVIAAMVERVKPFDLRGPVDFSVLSLIGRNPGVTSRQLCHVLDILPPNLVGIIKQLEARGLVERIVHPTDGRAHGLYLTDEGEVLTAEAETTVLQSEDEVAHRLSKAERQTLIALLKKVYSA